MIRAVLGMFVLVAFAAQQSLAADAQTVKQDNAMACISEEALQTTNWFQQRGDRRGLENALRNRECVIVPHGTVVSRLPTKPRIPMFANHVRIPGVPGEWWMYFQSFKSDIELEQMLNTLKKIEAEMKADQAKRERARDQSVRKRWGTIPLPEYLSLSGERIEPATLFSIVSPSLWVINTTSRDGKSRVQGSAVAVAPHMLLTNCHVVENGRDITLNQQGMTVGATVIAADPKSDRCILEAKGTLHSFIRGFRDYATLKVGERVYSLGSPKGLESTFAEGMISGLRSLNSRKLVQTSAPISGGSSGGALFDERGNLVGITTFMVKDAQSLNFAISVEEFWRKD